MLELVPEIVQEYWYLLPAFFCVAILYSSVGFGGGSSYLAILAICGIEFRSLRAIALLCNIIVVTAGTYIFHRQGHLRLSKVIPLVVASIPLAFLGGKIQLSEEAFFTLLGCVLVVAAVLLWIQPVIKLTSGQPDSLKDGNRELVESKSDGSSSKGSRSQAVTSVAAGGTIGLVSGVVGIGGGIFLSPALNLIRWDNAKVIAATASFFILVNSVSGLIGQATSPGFSLDWSLAIALMVCVFLGGQVGSRLGAKILPAHVIRRLTAILVLLVGLKQFLR